MKRLRFTERYRFIGIKTPQLWLLPKIEEFVSKLPARNKFAPFLFLAFVKELEQQPSQPGAR